MVEDTRRKQAWFYNVKPGSEHSVKASTGQNYEGAPTNGLLSAYNEMCMALCLHFTITDNSVYYHTLERWYYMHF